VAPNNSPNLNSLVWGQCWSFITSQHISQKQFLIKELQEIWSAIPEKNIDNAVKDYRKRLQACVSAISGDFEHFM